MADVFISYSRNDRERVAQLAAVLENKGFSVWWDHEISGGAAFAAEIERALNAARTAVVAWSVNSVQSEWVVDEAGIAKNSGKLIPIQLDATLPPIGFRQHQAIDFSNWTGAADAEALGALVRSIERFAGGHMKARGDAQPQVGSPSGRSEAIAVLPLENFTGDPGQQFFVDGMHEALILNLSRIGAIKVISRTSVRRYAHADKAIREIGAELGASRIIEGSVMRFDNVIRINVQLLDAHTDTHLWSESFDRDMSNILKLQSELALAVAEGIKAVLTPQEEARLAGASRVRPEAYESYLKGMFHWYKLTPQDLQSALEHFNTALAQDPGYAPAHAGIAAAWAGIQQMGAAPTAVAGPKIKSAVDKALQLDPGLAQAHFTLGTYYTWAAWDWARAEPSFQKAIELNPNFPDAHAYYAHYLNIVGRFDRAETEIRRALDLDPFNPLIRSLYAACLFIWERLDAVELELKAVLSIAPDHWLAFQLLRLVYHNTNRLDEALEATRSLYTTLGNTTVVDALDSGLARGGYRQAIAAAAEELARQADTQFVLPTQIAILFGQANEVDQAIHWLEKAYEVRDPDLPYEKRLKRLPEAVLQHPRTRAIIAALDYPDAISTDQ